MGVTKTKWYAIPHTGEVGSYKVAGELTDFPRGIYLAYSNCCLVTGMDSEQEAKEALTKYPCQKHQAKKEISNIKEA